MPEATVALCIRELNVEPRPTSLHSPFCRSRRRIFLTPDCSPLLKATEVRIKLSSRMPMVKCALHRALTVKTSDDGITITDLSYRLFNGRLA